MGVFSEKGLNWCCLTGCFLAEYAFSPTNGFAMTSTERPNENLLDIRRQLDDAKRNLDVREKNSNESLRDFEYRVKKHSEKILSLKIAEQIQRQLIEQDARDAEEQLKKKTP
jgi:hypothetical protein